MYKDDDDLFDSDDADDLDVDVDEEEEDWEDYDDEDLIYLEDEGRLLPGTTPWGFAWIFVSAIVDTIDTHHRFWDNLRTDLAYRHNKNIDESEFIGSVEAGIEQL